MALLIYYNNRLMYRYLIRRYSVGNRFCWLLISALMFLCLLITPAYSESQSAHIHGSSDLTLALEANTLEIQFISPLANLVGFEHQAHTADEKHRVKQAQAVLKSARYLFSFVGTECEVKQVALNQSNAEAKKSDQHKDHTAPKKNHSAHYHDSAHQQEGSDNQHETVSHSEMTVDYRFFCKSGTHLNSVVIHLFDHFPGVEKINAMWVTPTRQEAGLLRPTRNSILLR